MRDLPELLVIRHGETEWNRAQRMQGRLDSLLTPYGQAQARVVGGLLRELGVSAASHALWTSPQARSVATARLALPEAEAAVREDEDLSEVDVGAWSGRLYSDLVAAGQGPLPEESPIEYFLRAPEGEGWDGVRTRVMRVLGRVSRPTVLFTHGLTGRVLRTLALGLGREQLDELPGGQGVVFRISNGAHETLEPAAAKA